MSTTNKLVLGNRTRHTVSMTTRMLVLKHLYKAGYRALVRGGTAVICGDHDW